jgi:hypothetical protein
VHLVRTRCCSPFPPCTLAFASRFPARSLAPQFTLEKPDAGTGSVARAYLKAGDHDRALAWLDKVYEERSVLMRFLNMPEWDPLRTDPRFQDLLRRANGRDPARDR